MRKDRIEIESRTKKKNIFNNKDIKMGCDFVNC